MYGPHFPATSLSTIARSSPTSEGEAGSSGALAPSAMFHTLDGEKNCGRSIVMVFSSELGAGPAAVGGGWSEPEPSPATDVGAAAGRTVAMLSNGGIFAATGSRFLPA